MNEVKEEITRLISTALNEDISTGDITSEACIPDDAIIQGKILLKQGGRIAGLPFLEMVFKHIDPKIEVSLLVKEGSDHIAGTTLGTIKGSARGILCGELVALNILQLASGIATKTRSYVEELRGLPCDILDTRRTYPGLRYLEKYAVRIGGGKNHRSSLDTRFIIKKNHLAFTALHSSRPILEAVQRVRNYKPDIEVEVEAKNLRMVQDSLEAGVDIIMLEGMTIPIVCKAVEMIGGQAYVEASGGMTLDTIRAYASTGVNGIAVSTLTHSVDNLDISLRF